MNEEQFNSLRARYAAKVVLMDRFSRFYRHIELGPFVGGRRKVLELWPPMPQGYQTTWLTNRPEDPAELVNLTERYPDKVREMQRVLRHKLYKCKAPYELLDRLQIIES